MIITKIDGHADQVSYLICMMNYTRSVTLSSVHKLTQKQLDTLMDQKSNTIGALLYHIAAIEYSYFVNTFQERELSEAEVKKWGPAIRLGQEAREKIHGNDLDYYVSILNEVRENTLSRFKTVNDEWLHTIDE